MRSPIEHCEEQIARLRAEIERREAIGHDCDGHRRRMKTLQALRDVHATESTTAAETLPTLTVED